MEQEPRQVVGRALSVARSIRPPQDPPASISSLYKYFPAEYECVRLVPLLVFRWNISKVYRELFYFSGEAAQRAAIGLAQEQGLPFILGLKDNKKASASDLAILNPME